MMKKLAHSALVAFILLAGYGCDRSANITDRHDKDTEKQQPDQEAMAEAAAESGYGEDAAKPGVDSRAAQQPDSSLFVVKAASGGLMEVALGKMVLQKGTNDELKRFAQTMVTDHGKANSELTSLAGNKGIALPQAPLPAHQKHIDHLSGLSGAAFDKAYINMMVEDHQKDIAEFQKASQSGQEDPAVKAFAQKTLPVLKKHLELAKKTQAKVQQTSAR